MKQVRRIRSEKYAVALMRLMSGRWYTEAAAHGRILLGRLGFFVLAFILPLAILLGGLMYIVLRGASR